MYDHHNSELAKEGELISADFRNKEHLYQSKETFKLGKRFIETGILIAFANILLFLSGSISATTAKTTGELTYMVILCGRKLSKDASDKLNGSTEISKKEASQSRVKTLK